MSIDLTGPTVAMLEKLMIDARPAEPFFRDDVVRVGHTIYGLGAQGADGRRTQLDFFFTDKRFRLLYREKRQELLRGAFGTVYAKAVYYYDPRYKGQATEFGVEAYSKVVGVESPAVSKAISVAQTGDLVAISLVRVVRAHPDWVVFSATYSPEGSIRCLSVDAARGGDWVGPDELVGGQPPVEGGRFYRSGIQLRSWYGIPEEFPILDYLREPAPRWKESGSPEEFTVVHLHYDRNRWVRQDIYPKGRPPSTRFLHFPSTEQDEMLNVIDRKRGFGSWSVATWD